MNVEQTLVVLDEPGLACTVNGGTVDLTAAEYRVLKSLAGKPNTMVSRSELSVALYGDKLERAESNVLEVLVSRLRRKLAARGAVEVIQTIRGQGYRFVLNEVV